MEDPKNPGTPLHAAIGRDGLPSLPRALCRDDTRHDVDYYTADDLYEYGAACRKDERQRTLAAEWEACNLRGKLTDALAALLRIAEDCTARKAVMIAREAIAKATAAMSPPSIDTAKGAE